MAFHEVRFPVGISRSAKGGPRYRTTILTSASNFEQRAKEWDESSYQWSINLLGKSPEEIDSLIEFFHLRAGAAHGFRFKDWTDYYAGLAWSGDTLEVSSPNEIGTGDGVETDFQLVKVYSDSEATVTRKIVKPVASTVRIFVDDVEAESGWTVDESTGIVTFGVAPSSGEIITWVGEFDVPVRFDSDEMNLSHESPVYATQSVSVVGLKL